MFSRTSRWHSTGKKFWERRRALIDLTAELSALLDQPDVKNRLILLIREAVRTEVTAALNDELLDVESAAKIVGISPAALRKAVERGRIPCVRIRRRVQFRRAKLLGL